MADNVAITAGVGTTVAADEVADGTLGSVKVQFVKLMDGTLDGTDKAAVGANGLAVDVKAVPADPFGANADAAVAAGDAGSLSAKLRRATQGLEDLKSLIVLAAGSNAIGKLAANSGVDIGDVDVTSAPARDRTTDNVGAALVTDVVMNDTTPLTPKFAKADVAASQTDSNIVTAVGGKKLRVLAFICQTGGTATTLVFNSKPAGAGTAISMIFQNGVNGGAVGGFNPVGWFETASGEGLTVTTGAGSTTGVQVVYVEV